MWFALSWRNILDHWVILGEIYLVVTRSNRATVKIGNKGWLSWISYTGGRSSYWQGK